jgi:hypothetical protein
LSAKSWGREAFALAVVLSSAPLLASAEEAQVSFEAGSLEADPRTGTVVLRKNVVLGYERVRIRSDELTIKTAPGEVSMDGTARLAFCPCPDPPVAIAFSGARIEDGDLFLRFPRVEIASVPVFVLPYLWLRSPDRIGLLPPIVELRGEEGLLLGGGVRLPLWPRGQVSLTAAGFVEGGVELGARVETERTKTRFVFDEMDGQRGLVEARGSYSSWLHVAWDADAIRGDRARTGTVELASATRPFDTANLEVSAFASPGAANALSAVGFLARSARGDPLLVAGPRASAALGGRLASAGSWDATAASVVLGLPADGGAMPISFIEAGAELDVRPGPLDVRLAGRVFARGADDREAAEATREELLHGRLSVGLPIARRFESSSGDPPVVHVIEPLLELRGAVAHASGEFFAPLFGALPERAWLASGGVSTSIGTYAGKAVKLDARAGALSSDITDPTAVAFGRLVFEAPFAMGAIEAAATGAGDRAFVGRTRLGSPRGPHVSLDAINQVGAAPAESRAIASGTFGTMPAAYLVSPGWSGGVEVGAPFFPQIHTRVRADADLETGDLLGILGAIGYRHACACFGADLLASHRLGRGGADVVLAFDITPPEPGAPRAPR